MKKKFFHKQFFVLAFIIFGILITINISSAQSNPGLKKDQAVIIGFENSGAKFSKAVLTLIIRQQQQLSDTKILKSRINKILEQIKPEESSVVTKIEYEKDVIRANILCTKGNKSYNILIEGNKFGVESYEIIDITFENGLEALKTQREMLANLYKDNWQNANLSMSIEGFYEGRMNSRQISQRLDLVLKALNAKKVEELHYDTDQSISALQCISAFSKNIEGSIRSGDENVNLQAAARYSSFDDKTYIWIGTPLINLEY